MRERCAFQERVMLRRLEELVPRFMREADLDMWIVMCHEDHLEPIFKLLVPVNNFHLMVQILVFCDRGDRVERLSLCRNHYRGYYERPYDVRWEPEMAEAIGKVVAERDPKRIGLNQAAVAWCGDGLGASHKEWLLAAMGEKYAARTTSAEYVCRRLAEYLLPEEIEAHAGVVAISHGLLAEIYSRKVIEPGRTTAEDLEWYYWQRAAEMGLEVSFKPSFRRVRRKSLPAEDPAIQPGDCVVCDVGVRCLDLCSDSKQWCYILREGEADAPAGLKALWQDTERLREIFLGEFAEGCTGNEILRASLGKARGEGMLEPRVYSHYCGHYLHQPGPLIGHPNSQTGIPGRGDVPMQYNTAYTVEISVDGLVPEWDNEPLRFATEEQAVFTQEGTRFIDGGQTEFYLV